MAFIEALNDGFAYREQIDARGAGLTVLRYLSQRYTHSPLSTWLRRIEAGEVLLADRRAQPDDTLSAGDCLVWHRPPWTEAAVPLTYEVVYEDEDLLAVDKPSGLPTMPAGGFLRHTLLALVRRRHPEATPMHRLGRGTSGVLLFARNEAARCAVQAAWRGCQVRKSYRTLVQGKPPAEPFSIDQPIGLVDHPLVGRLHAAVAGGRQARSHVTCVEQHSSDALVDVLIETGRPHQIRIHLAWAGYPLVGDPLYLAGGGARAEMVPGDSGYLLHARALAFPHPRTGRELLIESPLPQVLRSVRESGKPGRQ